MSEHVVNDLQEVENLIELQHVNVARGLQTVLHDINLKFRGDEPIAILGPNGCGKSTLIKTLTCECYPLVQPETRVRIFGRERWDLTELRKRLGLVSSEALPKQTLQTEGLDAVITGFFFSSTLWPNLKITEEMREKAAAALARLNASYLEKKPVGEMSAGQQRRVMIARALVASGHRTLLLDEPTNALDLAAQQELRETMRELAAGGTGIILVTHHIADIIPELHRVVMMREGRIVADGQKKDLITAEQLQQLFGVRVQLEERDEFIHAW